MKAEAMLLPLLLVLVCTVAARGAMPEVLPYGVKELPVPPSPRINGNEARVVDLLGAQLDNVDPLQRSRIVAEIGSCQLPNAAPFIRKALGDKDALVRAQAAKAAASGGDKALLEDLRKLTGDPDVRVRVAVMQSAGALGGEAIVAAGLADSDATVVTAAVDAAVSANVDAIAKALAGYPAATQVVAIRTLGRLKATPHAGAVAPFLSSTPVAPRAAATAALGQMAATDHAAAVEKLLADPHPTVRRAAVDALATLLPAAEFQKRAIAALADGDLSVREAAANALAKSPTPDAIEALAGNLAGESSRLHLAARNAMVAIGAPVVPRAEQLLADANPRRREDGSFILGQLKSDASLEKHIALLADSDWGVIREAAGSLGRIGRTEAVPELARLANLATAPLDSVEEPQREAWAGAIERAMVACGNFGEKSVIPVARKALPNKLAVLPSIRCAAAYTLGRIDDPKGPVPGMVNRILNDQEDSSDVKLEGLKALGHMKSATAKSWVGTSREDMKAMGDTATDWVAHWVRWRLTGTEVPYEPIPEVWTASVSISLIK